MSETLAEQKLSPTAQVGLWASLVVWSISVAKNLQLVVDLTGVSAWIVRNWEWVTNSIREWVREAVRLMFNIELSWVTARLVPTLMILVSILAFSLRHRLGGAGGQGLGLASRAPTATRLAAFALIASMVVLEQSYFSLYSETDGRGIPAAMSLTEYQEVEAYLEPCRQTMPEWARSLDFFCAFRSFDSPVVKEVVAFQWYDWLIAGTYLALFAVVVIKLQEEVFVAFLLAGVFIALGRLVTLIPWPA